jgi:hypothetical protein
MSVYSKNNDEISREEAGVYSGDDIVGDRPLSGTKFNISMEKKIERLWHESKALGWTFTGFATHVMEILIIIQYRNRVSGDTPKRRRIGSRTQ